MSEQFGQLIEEQKEALRLFAHISRHHGDDSVALIGDGAGGCTYQGMQSGRFYADLLIGYFFSKELQRKGYVKVERAADTNATIATLQRKGVWYARYLWIRAKFLQLTKGKPLWIVVVIAVCSLFLAVATMLLVEWLIDLWLVP